MRSLIFLSLFLVCALAPIAQAQNRGLVPPFRVPTAETNNGAPLADDDTPKPNPRRSQPLTQHFKIFADGSRMPDKNNPKLNDEQLDIIGLVDWKFDSQPYGVLVYCYSDGQVYLIVRDSKWGRDAYGFGESLIKTMIKQGITVKTKGEIDYKYPYVIHCEDNSYEIETYRDTNWVDKFYEIISSTVQNIIIPKMVKLPMKKFLQTEMEVGEALNFKPLKDWLWRNGKGKTFKPNLENLDQLIEKQEKAVAEKEQKTQEQKTIAQTDKPE